MIHVQSSGKEEANGSNILVAFLVRESHAVYYLQKQNLSRLDVVEYLSHGANKDSDDVGFEKNEDDDEINSKNNDKEFLSHTV